MEEGSRRTFLKIILVGITAFFVFIWNKLTLNHIKTERQKESLLPLHKNKTVSFFDNYIVVNKDNTTTVFTTYCSHLGCKINKMANDRLVCPCHGSEYDLNGNVIKGPAYKNLEIIPSKITPNGKNVEIEA